MPETFCLMPDAPTYKKKYICVSYEGEEGVLLRSLVCAALLRLLVRLQGCEAVRFLILTSLTSKKAYQ